MGKLLAFILTTLLVLQLGAAENIIEMTLEGRSKRSNLAQARNDILEQVMKNAARLKVIELIGEEKYNKNRAFINTLVLKQAAKFIPVATPSKMKRAADGSYSMSVNLKLSAGSLRSILQKNGLLYERDGQARILPMIAWEDRINSQHFSWWTSQGGGTNAFLQQLDSDLNKSLYNEFAQRGFYSFQPLSFPLASLIPSNFVSERLRTSDFQFYGDLLQSDIVATGSVEIVSNKNLVGASTVMIRISAIQTVNGRTIAEVSRNYDTETGLFETTLRNRMQTSTSEIAQDLAVQIREAWEKGTFGANLLQLALRGNFDYQSLKDIKEFLVDSFREVKTVKERKFLPNEVVFEIDYKGGAEKLANQLNAVDKSRFPYRIEGLEAGKIVLSRLGRPDQGR